MGQVKIRNLDDSVILRLDELAKKKKKSREAYLRDILITLSISGELFEQDFKYANLVETISDLAKMYGDVIDKNNYLLDEILDRMNMEE